MIEGYDETNNPLPSSYVVKITSPEISYRIEEKLISIVRVEMYM